MESLQVSDYMNTHPVNIGLEMPVAEAVELLLDSKQSGGPVVDNKGKVVGFLSEQDCIGNMIASSYYREQICRVSEIMKTPVVSVKPYMSVLELAQKLLKDKPRVYPVVDDDGVLLGTINRTQVLKAIDIQLRSGYQQAS
ncbi:CBS domain-containing protein [Alteromonas sp. KUL49]|uniref:CBS domain-containing protein n=1 Tax=Alteromonas sp. KUL49 TaxID=2480798 RepID=UPI00102F15B6|nr:CBS domain-containing protein [Alteromonas sp. KUL49]TAP40175.1 CBS domain-containing protein [Alteromonas sp. KUL49]GEA11297.1 CBS domain-containing protein [Alteromonas sp. KUL49]